MLVLDCARVGLGAVVLFALAWAAWVVARRALRASPASVQAAGAVVAFAWLLTAEFLLLAAFVPAFRPAVVTVLSFGVAAGAHRAWGRGAAAELRAALAGAWRGLREASRFDRVLAMGFGVLAVARIGRSCIAPPLGQDAIGYHLVRAARWASSGSWAFERLPDMGRSLDAYPVGGDVPWAFALVVPRNDALVGLVSGSFWLAVLPVAYALARRFGAPPRAGALAALAAATLPAVSVYATAAYVDTELLVFVLAAGVFLGASTEESRGVCAGWAGAAMALACGAKLSALPIALVAAIFVATRGVRATAAFVLGLSPLALELVRTWRATGNPVYPLPLHLPGIDLAGDELFTEIVSARLFGVTTWDPPHFFRLLLLPGLWVGRDETGLGPAVLFAIPAAALAIGPATRRGAARLLVFGALVTSFTLAPFFASATLAYRTGFAIHAGRFLTPAVAFVFALASANPRRWAPHVLRACAAVGLLLSLPHGWASIDVRAFGWLLLACLAGVAVFAGVAVLARTSPRRDAALALGALGGVVATLMAAQPARRAMRYAYYELAAHGRCFDLHVIVRQQSPWAIWRDLDGDAPHIIAAFGGWDGYGGFWERYPLFGARLQNQVVYVPPTKGGEILDYRTYDPTKRTVAMRAWVRRLLAADVDVVLALPPPSFENVWIAHHPEIFRPRPLLSDDARSFDFDAAAARAWLTQIEAAGGA